MAATQKNRGASSDESVLYLGPTMDLNWKHQIQRMTVNLRNKLEVLGASYASPRQTLKIIRTAIIPSLACAFAVTPPATADLIIWDQTIIRTIEHKFKLWKCTATAMICEDTSNFGLGAPWAMAKRLWFSDKYLLNKYRFASKADSLQG